MSSSQMNEKKREKMLTIVKGISIEKFRRFHNVDISLASPIVAIAGQNGTQKTSLLGMIAHPFSLKDSTDPMSKEKDVTGRRFGSDIQTKFKFDTVHDKPGEHVWNVQVDTTRCKRDVVRCVSSLRTENTSKWRFSDPSKKKGTGYIQCPTIYLSLRRLMPIGELKAITLGGINLDGEERKLFAQWHNEILLLIDKADSVSAVGRGSKQTIGVETATAGALTMSAGQDNVGEIIAAVLSMRRLKRKYGGTYHGGLIFIDEIDAAMFPASQVKLMDKMLEWARMFGIQFFFTTHSEYLLKMLTRDKFKDSSTVIYLHREGSEVRVFKNPSMREMHSDMMVGMDEVQDRADKIAVYSEDDVTVVFIDELLDDATKENLEIIRGVDLGAGNLKALFDKGVREFQRNLVVLDGDMEDEKHGAIAKEREKYFNFVCLPGTQYPEKELFRFFAGLTEDNMLWERGLGAFNKQKCFRDCRPDEKDKGKIKRWFQGQDDLRPDGRRLLVRSWLAAHPDEKKDFQEKFAVALGMVREYRAVN